MSTFMRRSNRLLFGATFGIQLSSVALLISLVVFPIIKVGYSFFVSLPIIFFLLGIAFVLLDYNIPKSEKRVWDGNNFASTWRSNILEGISKITPIASLIMAFCIGIWAFIDVAQDSIAASLGIILGALVGAFLGIIVGIAYGIYQSGYSKNERILQISSPLQRFEISENPSIFYHYILCSFLMIQGFIPEKLVHFLNEMSRRHLLEFDGNLDTETGGGSWRWRHRIIQEWFLRKEE